MSRRTAKPWTRPAREGDTGHWGGGCRLGNSRRLGTLRENSAGLVPVFLLIPSLLDRVDRFFTL